MMKTLLTIAALAVAFVLAISDFAHAELSTCDAVSCCETCPCESLPPADFEALARKAYKQSFINNDFSYLNDTNYAGWHLGERLKGVAFDSGWRFDLGGQYRLRFHDEDNLRVKPLSGRSDEFLLHRTRLYADARYGDLIRFYAEAIDATSEGNDFTERATEVNRTDAINLFIESLLLDDFHGGELTTRVGRQELIYGSQRLLSSRPWRNSSVTFDGAKLFWKNDTTQIDGFWVRPIDISQHIPRDHNFDNPDQSQQFFGFFATHNASESQTANIFYLGLTESDPRAISGAGVPGDYATHTIGGRLKDSSGQIQYEVEGGYQFGDFSTETHSAGFLTTGLGYQWSSVVGKPQLWAFYDWASGDADPNDNRHGTFLHQFPRGHYYLGISDVTGRQNIEDYNLQLTVSPSTTTKVTIAYHYLTLANRRDAVYNPGGSPIYHDPSGTAGDKLGHELDVVLATSISPRTHVAVGYSHFFTGSYFDSPVIQGAAAGQATNGANGEDSDFAFGQFTLRF